MNKRFNTYGTKEAFEIKDISNADRSVAIYLSKFNNVDSDYDMIVKGAFKQSIMQRGPESMSNRKIAFLRYHDWEHQIGKFTRIEEDDNGLFAVGQLGTSSKGEDAFRDYEEGIIREHSIGYQYIQDKMKWIDDSTMPSKGYWLISELKLFEGSAVTFGANEMTPVVEVMKSEERQNYAVKISNEIDLVSSSIVKGKGSDERLYELEMKLKYLNGQLLQLAQIEPQNIKHSIESKSDTEIVNSFDWNKVVEKLKL